ncbi:MAG TPA: HAMP domain-containing sensor histidine kinase [Vicinamibacteria bacterium]|nr:HAMP domain-containing sensor histidine kinase [Vicinamibacteria bacterium]
MKRRLYLQVYLAFLGILFLFGALVTMAWYFLAPGGRELLMFDSISAMAGEVLPRADAPVSELQSTLERLSKRFHADLAVHDAEGRLLASVGEALPAPSPQRERSGWIRNRRSRGAAAFRLPDGRWLVARHDHPPAVHVLWLFVLLAGAIALGSYPLARRITRRLERLQSRVDELGAGDLSARVKIEGDDEVAALAHSFNQAASQIERLVNAQRHMLASASHELRSPLARMRVAIELLGGEERPDVRAQISRDIQELDDLIEELLLASRLDALEKLEVNEDVDLLAILAEEGARSEASVTGEPVSIRGDPRMLRRLIRNLIDNARRYAAGAPIEASVVPHGRGARLLIADRGEGVPEEERENIFKPFYRPPGMREGEDRGVGLGLALVRQIARRHEGDARCLPREGGGTCFEVTLRTIGPA